MIFQNFKNYEINPNSFLVNPLPNHSEQKLFKFTSKQLFDLVVDIDLYHEFLPWCVASRVTSRKDNLIIGDLVIGFKIFREKFTSEISLTETKQ